MENNEIYSKLLTEEHRQIWDTFVENSRWSTVLQLWAWGETKRNEGWQPVRIGVFKGDKLILGAQILVKKASFLGNIMYIPHGPVFHEVEELSEGIGNLNSHLIDYARSNNCFSIEIEPMIGEFVEKEAVTAGLQHYSHEEIFQIFQNAGYQRSLRNVQPKYKLFYDLAFDDETLMSMMKKKTRYNVKLAKKKGVIISKYYLDDPKIEDKLKKFYEILIQTQKRAKGYPVRPYRSFLCLIKQFSETKNLVLFEASYQNMTIAMNISEFTKNWASSFYASSTREHTNVKATYLLRWESIKEAKNYGSRVYDFWGIMPGAKEHEGYTKTKLSFGGVRFDTVGVMTYPISALQYFVWDKVIPLRAKLSAFTRKLTLK